MLLKFAAVEQIGRFSKLTHKAEPLARLSLVFGRNGYGKSTLCSILRSASDGKSDHITARRRLGALGDSRVESHWASGATIAYSAGKWNGCPGQIHIFDQEYVSRNLHVGDSVTRENKRSLLPIVLGNQGVALAEKVVALDKEQRELDQRRQAQARLILARCRGLAAADISAFCEADMPEDLSERIAASMQRVELARQSAVVKQKTNPPPLPLGVLARAEAVLTETLDGVSDTAASLVAEHLERHSLGDRAHAWLEYGTSHAPAEHCPYCAQGTGGLPLVTAFRAYFSDAFKALKERVDELERALDDLSAEKLDRHLAGNAAEFAYWSKLCALGAAPRMLGEELSAVTDALTALRLLVKTKRQNPLETVKMGLKADAIRQAIGLLRAYNEAVAASGAAIDQARAETADGNVEKAERTHAKWLALAEKKQEPVRGAVAAHMAAESRLEVIRVEKSAAQVALTSYTKSTMAGRQTALNEILADFGASFRVVDAKTNFVGREPNTEFAIEIGRHKVKAGDKSDTEPSFKTVLSAGDKTTLALAFFLAHIAADPNLASEMVVFDDPFSSQDMDRQFQTTSHIRAIAAMACQTIVLSHDPRFLQLIEKNAESAIVRTFQLQCSDKGEGVMERWCSTDELKSLYVQQMEVIREYASHQKLLRGQTLNSIHQAIRPFLEDYLRLRFPGRFADQAHIYEMATAIRDAGQTDPFAGSVADLLALNEYTRTNMHGGGAAPVPGELRAHCKKVVSIVGSY